MRVGSGRQVQEPAISLNTKEQTNENDTLKA